MRQRSRGLRVNHAGNRRQLKRHFVEHEYFVEAYLDVLVQFGNDVNPSYSLRQVQRLVLLFFCYIALQHTLQAGNLPGLCFLRGGIRFVGNRRKKGGVDHIRG